MPWTPNECEVEGAHVWKLSFHLVLRQQVELHSSESLTLKKLEGCLGPQSYQLKIYITRISANDNLLSAVLGKGLGSPGVGLPWLAVISVFHHWGQGVAIEEGKISR